MPDDSPIPTQVGPYRILDTLGEGGMGTVYRAEQREPVKRQVALKLIKLGMDSKEIVRRFEQERQALALMDHEGIAKVFDCGTSERGQPYFVMELVKGIPLDRFCDEHRMSLPDRLKLMQQVCAAVQHAHQKGVVHRDLKPGNVLVISDSGRTQVKIIDFGLAKAMGQKLVEATLFTEAGQIIGTPEYMAPEQADPSNEDIDTRADIYSVGVMLYQVLVGALPFSADQLRKAGTLGAQRILREDDPPKPSTRLTTVGSAVTELARARRLSVSRLKRALQTDLDWVVLKALEKDRNRRYDTANALSADLQRYLDNEPLVAGPPSAAYRMQKLLRRYRSQVIAGALVIVASLSFGSVAFLQFRKANRNEQLARDRLAQVESLLTDARIEAEKNRIFADVAVLAEARRQEAGLYPAFPDKVPAMEAWLRDFGDPLTARLPELQTALATLRTRADPSTEEERQAAQESHARWPELRRRRSELEDEDEPAQRDILREQIATLQNEVAVAGYEFADATDGYLHRILAQLLSELTPFVESDAIPGVRARLAEAQSVRERTIDSYLDAWGEAIAAIRASDGTTASELYDDFELTPQLGLVPIGRDPESRLWEFVHLASGTPGHEIPERDPVTGRLIPTDDMGLVFVLLPGGTLPQGIKDNLGRSDIRTSIDLDPFFLSKYEMTQGQWLRLTGRNPSDIQSDKNLALPVETVSWFDSEEALRHQGLVLPTELRWEYACRAGTTTRWWTGDDDEEVSTHENVHSENPLAVGSKSPNPFGLFDMHGNLGEWCQDSFGSYGEERTGDGLRPPSDEYEFDRSYRGENHRFYDSEFAGSSRRYDYEPSTGSFVLGVRPAREVEQHN